VVVLQGGSGKNGFELFCIEKKKINQGPRAGENRRDGKIGEQERNQIQEGTLPARVAAQRTI